MASSKSPSIWTVNAPYSSACESLPYEILPEPMKITAFISRVTAQYIASEALVLPVEAQAAREAPVMPGVRKGRRHAVVLEAARGVHALVLQVQPAGLQADIRADTVRLLQQRLTFAHRDQRFGAGIGQQFVKPPHAAKSHRHPPLAPPLLEILQIGGGLNRSQSYSTSSKSPQRSQATRTSAMP